MFTTLSTADLALEVSLSEAIELAQFGGFDAVDLPMIEIDEFPDESTAPRFNDELGRANLRAAGWWLPIEFRTDLDTYKLGLQSLPAVARFAQAIGAVWCNTWMWPFSDDFDYQDNYKLHLDRLQEVASVLEQHGCYLGIEFVGPKTLRDGHQFEFISTLDETLELIQKIGEPNVGVLLDCWQWYTSHGTVDDLARLEPGQVTYVHLNDAPAGVDVDQQIDDRRMLPGATGVIDVATFLTELKTLRFDGPVAVEPFNAEVNALEPRDRVQAAYQSLKAVLDDSDVRSELDQTAREP